MCLACGAVPALAQPTAAPPRVLDGPTPAIAAPVALHSSIARDGTGGLVYLKGGHVFVSLLQGGVFQAPAAVDGSLSAASSQPVIAADNGGLLIVGFINAGNLYVVQRTSTSSGLSAPRLLAGGAANPSIQMSVFGKAYLAFAAADGSGWDVRAAYYYAGAWALESAPLNALAAGDNAGAGAGAPAVTAAGDGVGIVAWGEGGHIFTRRVWGISPSVVYEQADAPTGGCAEVSSGDPAIGAGGDSSYAGVAFIEQLACGSVTEPRVLYDRLRGSVFDGITIADGAPTTPEGADAPTVAVGEYGRGWVTSERTVSHDVYAMALGDNEWPLGTSPVNSLSDASAPVPTPAIAGFFSSLVAWQHDPGITGQPEIRVRYAAQSGGLGTETVLSSASQGQTDAAAGLTAAGNVAGEAAVAWVQSTASGNEIVTAQLYQPPGAPQPQAPTGYVRSTQPVLSWSPAGGLWGPFTYTVTIDGVAQAATGATALRVAAPLPQGPHRFQVSVADPAGLTSTGRTMSMFVDSLPPAVAITLTGQPYAGAPLKLHLVYTDSPAPLSPADASGIAKVKILYGDRTTEITRRHYRLHAYRKPGRYRLTVYVTDKAGNTSKLTLTVRITAKPKKGKGKGRGHSLNLHASTPLPARGHRD